MDIATLKARQKATWMSGDFGKIGTCAQPVADSFMSRVPIQPGHKVLDVACGTGNLAVVAAQYGGTVTGIDIAPNLIDQARARARDAGLQIQFEEGDAEALPYPDGSFDVVVSMFGVMFAPRVHVAAAELLRVCKPGGCIALASWTPEGFIGKMFRTVSKFHPPAPGVPVPIEWGLEETVRERLGDGIAEFRFHRPSERITYPFPVPGTIEFFRMYFGPTQRAFEKLSLERQAELRQDLEGLFASHNKTDDPYHSTVVPAEFLEVLAFKRT